MTQKLPSLRLMIVFIGGTVMGLGLYYLLAVAQAFWAFVVIGVVMMVVFELALGASRAVIYRIGARPDSEEPRRPTLHGRERYASVAGLIVGLVGGYLAWGPVLFWGHGGAL
ncbi:hypothetical protein [Thioclava electrotropha]|uniref:Uncharacterized protein n=1 Tax=Thioclava electrotropha TaxID=1549850 RepID=A0ABX6YW99_9RHOB|nr:hypothetical protein [Thioclava electrotropha]QPZ92141.1 hypothetical protein AKL02_015445 [Thioclava electrotropha]